ncbi:hypothetical protein BK648_12720 [Pseudomonas poae]|uniref:Uncharacterized protein n=1 Tax=Pseudomonas poae TaxID=200451 RepID=A0A423F396_9PSED|nr:hypothetical protein [Pseudomonas poae]ROM49050.1 hypothetical protein BK648_12720 [Pseudomonas poae]
MSIHSGDRSLLDVARLEQTVALYRARLKRLQRFWIPLQQRTPHLVLSLWIIGVITSLFSQSYYHWLFMAPLIGLLIILEIVIEEVQTDLLLVTAKTRYALDLTRGLYAETLHPHPPLLHKPGGPCPASHLHY